MSRALLVLINDAIRQRAVRWIAGAPAGTRVEFKEPKRTLAQNSRMWAMLTDVASQKQHFGQRYSPDEWKVIFLHALGRETRFVPALDGQGFIPIGQSSSDLSKVEMSDMIELMLSWGAQNAIRWSDPTFISDPPPGLIGVTPETARREAGRSA